jgi:hypothetical protein
MREACVPAASRRNRRARWRAARSEASASPAAAAPASAAARSTASPATVKAPDGACRTSSRPVSMPARTARSRGAGSHDGAHRGRRALRLVAGGARRAEGRDQRARQAGDHGAAGVDQRRLGDIEHGLDPLDGAIVVFLERRHPHGDVGDGRQTPHAACSGRGAARLGRPLRRRRRRRARRRARGQVWTGRGRQRGHQLARAVPARRRLARQPFLQRKGQRRARLGVELGGTVARHGRRLGEHPPAEREEGVARGEAVRMGAGQHLAGEDRQREDVGPLVDRLARELLGRHVGRRALDGGLAVAQLAGRDRARCRNR